MRKWWQGQEGLEVGQDLGRKEQKTGKPLPNGSVVQKRRQSYSFIAAKRKVGKAKPNGVETRNRFDVLTEEDQAELRRSIVRHY